ncbi:24507_t:CDS:2, partial [Cetraspora pellucida]
MGQANIVAINKRTAIQMGANKINEALNQPGNAIVKLRAVEARGRPTNNALNAPNANASNTVVVPGIHFGQARNMTIDELYRKILRIGRQANYRPEELHRKFLNAFLLPWLEKAKDIGEHLLLDELAKKLYEIELHQIARHKKDRIPDRLVSQIENAINEDRDAVNQLTNQLQKVYIRKCVICGETGHTINFKNTPPDLDNEKEDYNKENNRWTGYDLLKIDKPSDFAIKGNSKHITDSLGWYTDVPVTMKDKKRKTVTVIGNFVYIDNGKPEPMLFLGMSNIRKLQGVPEPNKNQFYIKLHRKTYVIPTYSKAPVAKEPSKEEQNQVSTDFSSLISEDLKK